MGLPRVGYFGTNGESMYALRMLTGLADYQVQHKRWEILYETQIPYSSASDLGIDGMIVMMDNRRDLVDLIAAAACPVVNGASGDSFTHPTRRLPQVMPDDTAVGRLVAEHFLERGFGHFAYHSCGPWAFSARRRQGFIDTVAKAGHACDEYPEMAQWWLVRAQDEPRDRWLRDLPKPCGLFAADDGGAYMLLLLCQAAGIRVPEDIAIVGVNDDEHCRMSNPALSSVRLDAERAGWEVAALLARLMGGEPAPAVPILVPPRGVVTRHSSNVLAIEDAEVRQAMHFIWDHADKLVKVEDVVRQVPISRRVLEVRFRKATGRSLQEEITRVHLERAKKLLRETDFSMEHVARACAFRNQQRLTETFRRELQTTPTAYRRQAQG